MWFTLWLPGAFVMWWLWAIKVYRSQPARDLLSQWKLVWVNRTTHSNYRAGIQYVTWHSTILRVYHPFIQSSVLCGIVIDFFFKLFLDILQTKWLIEKINDDDDTSWLEPPFVFMFEVILNGKITFVILTILFLIHMKKLKKKESFFLFFQIARYNWINRWCTGLS